MYLWCWSNSILCTSCDFCVYNKCSGITDHLTDNRNFVCRKCSGEIVPAAIVSFKEVNIGNDSFHVAFTFKYLGDTIGQCSGCSDAVSTRIVSLESIPRIVTYFHQRAIRTKLKACVRYFLTNF